MPVSVRVTNGGTVPGGIMNRDRLTAATTSAVACPMSVPGWKWTLMSAMPVMFRLSTCLTPFT